MFLNKKKPRPIGKGTFCEVPSDIRAKMRRTENYKREGNTDGYPSRDRIHLADTDLLYVIDDKAFDIDGMMRVIPINFLDGGYWLERVDQCAIKKINFLVHKSNLTPVYDPYNVSKRESLARANVSRLQGLIREYNDKYNLRQRGIQLKWESN